MSASVLPFRDRIDAGRRLAPLLGHLAGEDVVVLGLPRGGVPVAAEVARELSAPLDVLVVRKLGVPWQPELAMGAIGEGDVRVMNEEVADAIDLRRDQVSRVEHHEREELARRVHAYRGDRPLAELEAKTVVLVDDGVATGATAEAACRVARRHRPARLVFAAPVMSRQAAEALRRVADEVVYVEAPWSFRAIGAHYRDFSQTSDSDVTAILASFRETDR